MEELSDTGGSLDEEKEENATESWGFFCMFVFGGFVVAGSCDGGGDGW